MSDGNPWNMPNKFLEHGIRPATPTPSGAKPLYICRSCGADYSDAVEPKHPKCPKCLGLCDPAKAEPAQPALATPGTPKVTISREELDKLSDGELWLKLNAAGIVNTKPVQYRENSDRSMTYSQGECTCKPAPATETAREWLEKNFKAGAKEYSHVAVTSDGGILTLPELLDAYHAAQSAAERGYIQSLHNKKGYLQDENAALQDERKLMLHELLQMTGQCVTLRAERDTAEQETAVWRRDARKLEELVLALRAERDEALRKYESEVKVSDELHEMASKYQADFEAAERQVAELRERQKNERKFAAQVKRDLLLKLGHAVNCFDRNCQDCNEVAKGLAQAKKESL